MSEEETGEKEISYLTEDNTNVPSDTTDDTLSTEKSVEEDEGDPSDVAEETDVDIKSGTTDDTTTTASETSDSVTHTACSGDTTDVTTSENGTDGITSEGAKDTITSHTTNDSHTFEDAIESLSSETGSYVKEEDFPVKCSRREDFLKLKGRHIKSEDFEWAKSPILPLADIVVETARDIKSSDLQGFMKNATYEQKLRILELLPLNLPLQVTLPILDDGIYWKRLCLLFWPSWDVWRYSDSWKSMFIHRSVQELIENFIPDKDDIQELCNKMEVYSKYVTSLNISKLIKVTTKKVEIDVYSDNFDQQLDEIVSARQNPVYLDFEKIFECFPNLKSLTISLSPTCIDFEDFCFNNVDFNSLFRATRKLERLEKLKISNRNFSNQQISKFLHMLSTQNSIRELNLSYNFIDDCTCYIIAKLLIYSVSLENLNLMYNKITDEGAKIIASALYAGSNLKKLILSLNMIGDKGAISIAEVLFEKDLLTHLDLSKNKISEEGGVIFAQLVKKSRTLRSLKLQENFLGEEAGRQFAEAVKENDYILELEVKFCGFRQKDEDFIHKAVLRNRSKIPYKKCEKNDKNMAAAEFLF